MLYLVVKTALPGVLIATISEVAKRYPRIGGLIASLPLVSVLGMMWLRRDAQHSPRGEREGPTAKGGLISAFTDMSAIIPRIGVAKNGSALAQARR